MAVIASPYLLPPQALGCSNGQQTDLLDALLASCQKSAMNPPLPGYGRNLQPYFTSEVIAPRSASLPTKAITPPVHNRGKPKKAKAKSSNVSSDDDSKRGSISSPAKPAPKSQAVHDANKFQTIKAIHKTGKASPAVGPVWAGPTFGVAPAVSEIPFPSDFLLA